MIGPVAGPATDRHFVLGSPIRPPFPPEMATALFGMGCFWGAERRFWQMEGIFTTAVGYAGGRLPNPSYERVCTGMTGHNEVVLVIFDPRRIDYESLLRVFWQSHDPTQGNRQGNDIGTQYRSGIYYEGDAQKEAANRTRNRYQVALDRAGYGNITTEIAPMPAFYHAEAYHQQYLAKNPGGYCGLGGTGVPLPGPVAD